MKSIATDTKIIFLSALDAADELLSVLPGIKPDRHIYSENQLAKNLSSKGLK
ncbi:MAG TPA: hypothetical protein VE548_10955 [Nitrososphaeraceae archaeon]|jgi:hypothetical protein|nr:hypothetical protein [Nitrososphaeraceae archaeon]